ncbi:MAG: hypothetical protein ACRDUW_07745 [Pseudonocardiaceae bacterium]
MAHQPGTAATTRQLLTALATPPTGDTAQAWAGQLCDTVHTIQAYLLNAESAASETVPFTVLHQWRTTLDTQLEQMREANAELWRQYRQPGTWLDGLLRLRSIISHVVSKAYWDELTDIHYADIDIARYLWGAR